MAKSFQRFTLHVQLQHIEPPIWRRIEVEGTERYVNCTLSCRQPLAGNTVTCTTSRSTA